MSRAGGGHEQYRDSGRSRRVGNRAMLNQDDEEIETKNCPYLATMPLAKCEVEYLERQTRTVSLPWCSCGKLKWRPAGITTTFRIVEGLWVAIFVTGNVASIPGFV